MAGKDGIPTANRVEDDTTSQKPNKIVCVATAPLVPSSESLPGIQSSRKVRNAIAWAVISFAVGLVFSFDGGFSSFRAVLQSMREESPEMAALFVPQMAFLICLLTVFGQILGDTMTNIVLSREETRLEETGTDSVWNRNILSLLVGWAVSIQERIISTIQLEALLENELVQKVFPLITRIIAVIGGVSGTIHLAAFLRLMGGMDDFSFLYPVEMGAFSVLLLVIAFTSASSIVLLPAFGVELVVRGLKLFGEGGIPVLALLEIFFGAFFFLIFIRWMKISLAKK